MIEVMLFAPSGAKYATAEAEDAEGAMLAARTLLNESSSVAGLEIQGLRRNTTVRFFVDGEMVREIEGGRL